jgi:HSP20 family molecular chaperone IbpA
VERSSAFVQRRIRLPDSADLSKISAKLENGVLRLDIPKIEVR